MCCKNLFLYTRLKNGTYYGRVASTGFPLSKGKIFHEVFIKLGEYVGGRNISTKFNNQLNPPMHSWIMALELSKIRVSTLKVYEFSSGLYQTW